MDMCLHFQGMESLVEITEVMENSWNSGQRADVFLTLETFTFHRDHYGAISLLIKFTKVY